MERKLLNLAFVDMEFHKKTRSGDFLRELFSDKFIIHDFWYDDTKESADAIMKDLVKFEYVFFFQVLLPYKNMTRLRQNNIKIVWAPMYDGLPMTWRYWKQIELLKMKLLCFSSAVTNKAKIHNMDYYALQFFKKPVFEGPVNDKEKVNIFFWYRGNIAFRDWSRFLEGLPVQKITYKSAPDPKFIKETISEDDIKKYSIEIVDKAFTPKEEYIRSVQECDIFICPRRQEGIGMTLVEAIAMGKFLIGYNDNTMNDYIIHKKNGFLFNEQTTDTITLSEVNESMNACRDFAIKGYEEWEKASKLIPDIFVEYRHNTALKITPGHRLSLLFEKAKSIYRGIRQKKTA